MKSREMELYKKVCLHVMFCHQEILRKFPLVRKFLMYFLMFLMYLKLLVHVAFKNFILFNFNLNDFCYLVLDRYR